MDLSGTVKTPLGDVSKKNLAIGGVIAGILGVMWYRSYKADQAANASAAAGASEINPATGYPYGSAEDAAALQHQAAYQLSAGGGGGGSTYTPPATGAIVTNAQWSQQVLEYWDAHDLGEPTVIAAALGVYLAGGIPTADQINLIHQATAIAGLPPVEGNGGYPPHINTTPAGNPNPPVGDPNAGAHDEAHGWFTVHPGWHVSQWVTDVRAHPVGNPSATYESIDALNAGAPGRNINWDKDTTKTTFKRQETYRVR